MSHDLWLTSTDPWALWQALPPGVSGRKVRLWATACCRRLLEPAVRTPRYEQYAGWFAATEWLPGIEAAEEYADGRIDRRELRRRRKLATGGPHNVFQVVCGVRHFTPSDAFRVIWTCGSEFGTPSREEVADLIREVFGNPFRPVVFAPSWRTAAALALAGGMYESREFAGMPILADALEEAGCDRPDVLAHCRGPGPHVRGCWVVDLVLGKS